MEEIKKIEVQGQQYGVADMLMRSVMGGNAQVIEWSHTHNMNDYKDAGTYRIKGERTGNPLEDNLPIMNQGSGHTIDGILYVLDSSLPNGSGNSDDCTITQFLMLSNRVGGQEGDMYMRSAYGANKDNLTWKPWEKYQTNVEVGCVSNGYTLNPSNPTQAISFEGMNHLTDNGIYSGIYFPPKAMIGTPNDDAVIQDATAIETFVMVIINNYAAASNVRCITQVKFAVTNGGVFSMEKRSTVPGGYINNFSQWEAVGGGGSSLVSFTTNGFTFSQSGVEPSYIGTGVNILPGAYIDGGLHVDESEGIFLGSKAIIATESSFEGEEAECIIGLCAIGAESGSKITHTLSKTTVIRGSYLSALIGTDMNILGYYSPEANKRTLIIGTGTIIGKYADEIPTSSVEKSVIIGPDVRIEEGIHISGSESGDKIVFTYNGKTAELQLA